MCCYYGHAREGKRLRRFRFVTRVPLLFVGRDFPPFMTEGDLGNLAAHVKAQDVGFGDLPFRLYVFVPSPPPPVLVAQVLEVSLLEAKMMLRLERDAWSMIKGAEKTTNEYPLPLPPSLGKWR